MTELVMTLAGVFVAAGVLVIAGHRLGIPTVPALLVAGLLVGRFIDETALMDLAVWGIAFLVFVFGIRIDIPDLAAVFRDAEIAAAAQLIVVGPIAFAIGYACALAFGFDPPARNALYFAAVATLSSTIVGSTALAVDVRRNMVHGRLASAVHLFDDVVAIVLLIVLSAAVLTNPDQLAAQLGWATMLVVAGAMVYRYGFPLLVRGASGSAELVLMGSISILIAFVAAAELMGLSMVVGAFAAGIAIRQEGATALAVRNGIRAIRDFFVAIFFVTLGALVQLPSAAGLVLAAVLIVVSTVVNPVFHTAAFIAEGYDARSSFLASTNLNHTSELALVIVIQAAALGTIAPELFEAAILAAAATMAIGATTVHERWALHRFVEPRFQQWDANRLDERSVTAEELTDHAIIIGYGRLGRRVARTFEHGALDLVVIENDPLRRDRLVEECDQFVFGDATNPQVLERANADAAAIIVSTAENPTIDRRLLDRGLDAFVILRNEDARQAVSLLDDGADYVIVPDVLAGTHLEAIVRRIVDGEVDPTSLQDEHVRLLEQAEPDRRDPFQRPNE